jgi:polysaccharide biosynthesis protein VpsJ
MDGRINKVFDSIEKLQAWIEKNEYKGYEPFDGLSSYIRPLTLGNWFGERILQQVVLRSPYNIRPILGIRPNYSTKGMGFLSKAYLRMWKQTNEIKWKEKAVYCLDWLIDSQNKDYSGAAWGNHFDYSAKPFQLPAQTPTVVWVGLIGQSFLDAFEVLKEEKYLQVARSACNYILKDLPRTKFNNNSHCISYVHFKKLLIHNSNMLGAALLARTYSFTKEDELFNESKKAMQFACDSQLSDGSWYYGEEPEYHWIDNWHTAYNLDSLKCYTDNTNDTSYVENLKKGYAFFKDNFFTSDGRAKFYHDRLRFVDIQSAAQAIDTLCYFKDNDGLKLAIKIANWTIDNMQDDKGYFYYRDLGWKKVKIPMLHWGQATMFSALSNLINQKMES